MRKKIILRLLLLTAFMALLWSCQQELQQAEQEYEAQLQKNTVEWLSRAQLEKNHPQVLHKINQISPNTASENNKIYTDVENEFSIDTDESYVVKDGNGTKTYTFKIKRDSDKDEGFLENLILKDIGDGNFFAYFITYDAAALSNSREKPLSSEELSRHISLYAVGKKTSAEIFGKLNSCPMVFYPVGTYVYVSGHQCIEGLHDYGEPCAYLGTSNAATQGGYEVVYNMTVQETPGSCGGSGSGGGMGTTPVYGGGGGNINLPELNDPCEKTKSIVNNPKTKPAIDNMKNQSVLPPSDPNSGEIGYKFQADGTPSAKIIGGAHSVNFGDKTGYAGGYHNHTLVGIPMLSPPDIEQLLQFVLAQGNYGNPSNAFMGMVAPNGMHYVATFSGNYNDALISFSQQDLNNFTDNMAMRKGMYNPSTPNGFEKLFFAILNDMSLNGKVNLQRIESDGTIKTIIKNNDGTTTAVPCP